jgi:hypothetical protein
VWLDGSTWLCKDALDGDGQVGNVENDGEQLEEDVDKDGEDVAMHDCVAQGSGSKQEVMKKPSQCKQVFKKPSQKSCSSPCPAKGSETGKDSQKAPALQFVDKDSQDKKYKTTLRHREHSKMYHQVLFNKLAMGWPPERAKNEARKEAKAFVQLKFG